MIDSELLRESVTEYMERCRTKHKQPTFKGMGKILNISGHTVANVVHGTINGKPYNRIEKHNRLIRNSDFEMIREVFKEYTVNGIQ